MQSEREKELLEILRQAGLPQNNFSLTLKFNDVVLEDRVFSASKFSLETVSNTRTHFLMNDLIRLIIDEYTNIQKIADDKLKKEQIDKLWTDNNKI